jgi:4-hydroxy-2-oxoheptanedioate aldolase
MEISKNKFKADLNEGKTSYGIWNGIVDTYAAEIVAGAGFDWVLIDGEHAPFDLRSIIVQAQAIAGHGVPVLVRPPEGNPVLIKQLLDGGIQTLLIPMVETAEQAALMVKAMQYPPAGIRGVGTALARAAQWNRVNDYFKHADAEMCLILQVESVRGYENLDAICQVEGVDGVFIGPADLAASMGYLGQPMHPEVVEKVEKGLALIRKYDKTAGVLALNPTIIKQYEAKGANMIGVAIDTILLAKASKAVAESYKTELKKEVSNTKY